MRDYRDAKVMARALRSSLTDQKLKVTHSQSLELMAKVFGYDNWNILAAKIEADRPAVAAPSATKTLYCSFCGKSQHDVKTLVAGPDSMICNECVGLCNDIFEHGAVLALLAADEAGPGGPEDRPKLDAFLAERSTAQLRDYLAKIEQDLARIREGLRSAEAVTDARAAGKPPTAAFRHLSDIDLGKQRDRFAREIDGTATLIDIVARAVERRG
jgi:hypothetical protein